MGRRTRGEGSIYKQADGYWAAAIRVDGRPIVKRAKKQEDVRRWLVEMRGKADEGLVAPEGHRQTLTAYLKQWLATIQPTVRPATYNLYEYLIRLHIDPALGRMQLASLRPDQLQRLYADKLKAGLSRRTVQLCHVVLHKSLKQAMAWGLIPRNPADAASAPKPQAAEVTIWSAEQASKFLVSIKGDRLEALFTLALTTGMRRGELLGLKWEDIDLTQRRLYVRRTVGRVYKAGVVEGSPKSAAGRRQVLLSAPAIQTLREHRTQQLQDRLLAGPQWKDLGYVFTSAVGTPIEATRLLRAFVRLTESAGLPRIRLHDLRRTNATMMLGENVHPKIVQQTLGHAKISLTLDLYSHAIPTMQEHAVQAVERALGRTTVSRFSDSGG